MLKNSFLEQDFAAAKILILVPHQDDELNCAGALIKSFTSAGARVNVTYLTDGAFRFAAQLRKQEALAALRELGVTGDKVTFLGFPDRNNKAPVPHFYHDNVRHKQAVEALQKQIKDVKADLIVCVDYDYHCDHRALSLLFEEAMDAVLREPDNNYTPFVLKAFAYGTAFEAPADYWSLNLLSTIKPVPKSLAPEISNTDNPYFRWEERVRLPVPASCRTKFLFNNVIYKAACRHLSQQAEEHTEEIINADQVFWQKRTDNLAYKARISASSGKPEQAVSFRLFTTADILAIPGQLCCYGWHPEAQDTQKTMQLQWEQPQTIRQICFYTGWEPSETLAAVQVTSAAGFLWQQKKIQSGKNSFTLQQPLKTKNLQIKITGAGATPVLAGLGIFASPCQTLGKPLLKIVCGTEFVYDYILPPGERECVLDIYAANGLEAQGLKVKDAAGRTAAVGFLVLAAQKARLQGNKIIFQGASGFIKICAMVEGRPDLYDEVRISKKNKIWFVGEKLRKKIDKICVSQHFHLWKKYFHIKEKYFKGHRNKIQG